MQDRGFYTVEQAAVPRSGALPLLPLPDQLLDRARQRRLEVDQLRPRRGHDDPDHAVDRKSTRLNSSHANISYAVFCLKKKKKNEIEVITTLLLREAIPAPVINE